MNLIVCQKSKVKDWVEHIDKNYLDLDVWNLTNKKEFDWFMEHREDGYPFVGVINYDLIWRRKELLNLRDFTLLLDESSLIQNETAKRSRFILKMKPKNVILLSGTPVSGKYEQLWSQCRLLGWDIKKEVFYNSYIQTEWRDYGGFLHREVVGYKNVPHLKRRLREYGAVFLKTSEVMTLPEQIEQTIMVERSKEYKHFIKHRYVKLWDDTELMGENSLTMTLYARQLCGQYSQEKLRAFEDVLESTDDRLIVFYSYTGELVELTAIANDFKRPYSVVNGKIKDLTAYENEGNSITFIQYQAGAMGLNLQKANKVVYFTLPLGKGSCDLWEQSKKRIHRIGQRNTCFYYYLLVDNSIEIKNLESLKNGKDLIDDLFEKGGSHG